MISWSRNLQGILQQGTLKYLPIGPSPQWPYIAPQRKSAASWLKEQNGFPLRCVRKPSLFLRWVRKPDFREWLFFCFWFAPFQSPAVFQDNFPEICDPVLTTCGAFVMKMIHVCSFVMCKQVLRKSAHVHIDIYLHIYVYLDIYIYNI